MELGPLSLGGRPKVTVKRRNDIIHQARMEQNQRAAEVTLLTFLDISGHFWPRGPLSGGAVH